MTYVPVSAEETHILAVIALTGQTLYYADANLSMSDGKYYEGRLEVGNLSRAFSSWTEPKQRQSTLTMTLKDNDGTIRDLIDTYTWGTHMVSIYVGRGRNLADYILDFEGIIKFPGGISYDNHRVTVRLRDARDRDKVTLPGNKFLTADYPNLEEKKIGNPIPVVYGDWSDTAIPAACTDTTVNEFTIADHAIKSIVQVYKNGSPVAHTNEDLAAATFRIAAYAPGTDVVTVKCQGKTDSGILITHPVHILYDIQTVLLGIDTGDIDTDSYNDLEDELLEFTARRVINSDSSSDALIEELAIECGFDLTVENGLYTVTSRMPRIAYDTLYDETNVKADSMAVDYDPEGLYANYLEGNYAWDPANEIYLSQTIAENIDQQAEVGAVSRTINYNWLYTEADVLTTLGRMILLYSIEIRVVRFTGLGEAILEQIGNRVGLTFANFTERPLLLRETGKNFKRRSCDLSGYDVLSFAYPGYWTGDDAPNWDDATEAQRASQGFCTDDNGCAKVGDNTSKKSHWW